MRLMLRTAAVIIFLITLDLIFYSCRKPKEYNYKYVSAKFNLFEFDVPAYRSIGGIKEGDTTTLGLLQMYLRLEPEQLTYYNTSPNLFLNPSYALTIKDHYTNTSWLKRIQLKTLEDFNDRLKAGSNIEDSVIFILGYPAAPVDSAKGTTVFIDKFNNYPDYRNSYDKAAPYAQFKIRFPEKPTSQTPQQFAIEVEMEDGTVFRDTTVRFFVK